MPYKNIEDKRAYDQEYNRKKRTNRARCIIQDSRKKDKQSNLENNLTETFVNELIKHPCSYCGDTSLLMTLDRIENNIGHIKGNVVAACIRCNMIRRAMPYLAWLAIAPAIKTARIRGLFGAWTGDIWTAKMRGL